METDTWTGPSKKRNETGNGSEKGLSFPEPSLPTPPRPIGLPPLSQIASQPSSVGILRSRVGLIIGLRPQAEEPAEKAVEEVIRVLGEQHEVFVDRIKVGLNWASQIEAAFRRADCLIT